MGELGDKLHRIQNYNSLEAQVRSLNRAERSRHRHRGSGGTAPPAPDPGAFGVPVIDISDVVRTIVPHYDGTHNYRPFMRINVAGDYPSVRSFMGYERRVFPPIGARYEVNGPTYPYDPPTITGPSPIDIHNLPTPPQSGETWRVQLRVRTSLYGPGFWSDFIDVSFGGDAVAPVAPTWLSGSSWLITNEYNWGAHETVVTVQAQAGTPVDDDLNVFRFQSSLDGGTTWVDEPEVPWTNPVCTYRHLTPGASAQLRVFAVDTSGNVSGASAVKTLTVAGPTVPGAPTSLAHGTYDYNPVNGAIIVPLTWGRPSGYTGQLRSYKMYLTVNGTLRVTDLGLVLATTFEAPQQGAYSVYVTAVDLYGQESTGSSVVSDTLPLWVIPSRVPNGSFEQPLPGDATKALYWTPTTTGTGTVRRIDHTGGSIWDGQYAMKYNVPTGSGNSASLLSSLIGFNGGAPNGIPDQRVGEWNLMFAIKSTVASTGFTVSRTYYDVSQNPIGSPEILFASTTALPTGWTVYSFTCTLPSGAMYVKFLFALSNPSSTTTLYLDAVLLMRRIAGAELGTEAVDSSKIAPNAVTAVKIAAAAVDNTKLAAGTALRNIGAGGITGSYIAATTIPDSKLIAITDPTKVKPNVESFPMVLTDRAGTPNTVGQVDYNNLALGQYLRLMANGGGTSDVGTINGLYLGADTAHGLRIDYLKGMLLNGAVALTASNISANTTADASHGIYFIDASSGTVKLTLPNSNLFGGRLYIISRVDSTTNSCLVGPSLGYTLDGSSSRKALLPGESLLVWLDTATSWYCLHRQVRTGSSFPPSPSIGDTYFNTTYNTLAYWDGGNWLSAQKYEVGSWSYYPGSNVGDISRLPVNPAEWLWWKRTKLGVSPYIKVTNFGLAYYINGTRNPLNNWQVTLRTFTGTSNMRTLTCNVATTFTDLETTSFSTQPAGTDLGLEIIILKTASPGNLRMAPTVLYRYILG